MKIVKLKGGLGNQMFQYAFAKLLEQVTGDTVKLDFSSFTSLKNDTVRIPRIANFKLSLGAATNQDIKNICKFTHYSNSQSFFYRLGIFAEKTINRRYFWERSRAHIELDKIINFLYFDGYWQSYRYVDLVFDKLLSDFLPIKELSENTRQIQKSIQAQNAVFVGIRKGDYNANKHSIAHYGSFSSNYYLEAMEKISEIVDKPIFYIFSNDIAWCKENLDFGNNNIVYRETEQQTDDFEELMLMTSCKHAIIINSSYHWWGARLINNPTKIIYCPDKWFFDNAPIDIIPDTWHKIKAR